MKPSSPKWFRIRPGFLVAFSLFAGAACQDILGGSGPGLPSPLWRTPLAVRDQQSDARPAGDGLRLYALAAGVIAFDAQTGAPLWRAALDKYVPSNVVVRDGRVFTAEAFAFAFDAASGRELWRYAPDSEGALGESTADEYAFYFGTRSRRIYALDPSNGVPRWITDVGPDWKYPGIVLGVSVSGDTVYAAVRQYNAENGYISTGWIFALDRPSGRILWSYRNGNGNDIRSVSSAPTVAGRLLLASDLHGNSFFAVDRFTATEVWRVHGAPGYVGPKQAPSVVGEVAYVGSSDTYVYAADLQTGRVLWKTKTPASIRALAVCGDRIFANYLGLAVLDRTTGKLLGRSPDEAAEYPGSGFAVHGDRVFVLGNRAAYAYSCT